MFNAKRKNLKVQLSGIVLFCMVLFGAMLMTPATAQAARGHRGHYRPAPRRYYRPAPRRHYRHNYHRRANWGNLGWSIGNAVWSAVNATRYSDPIIIEKPVYVVPQSYDYDDDVDYQILRNWDYTPNTTSTRTEVIICP